MKLTLIIIPLLCPWLLPAATPLPEKPLKELVAESGDILVATITKVDMVDSQGKDQSAPELASTIRLHLTVHKDGVLKTDTNVPDKIVVWLSLRSDSSIGQLTKEEGSKCIFLFHRARDNQSFYPVYPSGFFHKLSKQREIEQLIREGLRAEKAGQSQTDDIREAVFRYLFDHNGSGQQKNAHAYYLGVGEKADDPTDQFMKRFSDHRPPVRKRSSCSSGDDGVRDKITGEQGLIFHVGSIKWISDTEVEVYGGHYEGTLGASGHTYMVKKENGKWKVTEDKLDWLA